jgi:hypothetical protein
MKPETNNKGILFGVSVGGIHFALFYPMAIYFGLGMDREGVWFLENIYMQPGYFVAELITSKELKTPYGTTAFATNFVFYSYVGYFVYRFFDFIKKKI